MWGFTDLINVNDMNAAFSGPKDVSNGLQVNALRNNPLSKILCQQKLPWSRRHPPKLTICPFSLGGFYRTMEPECAWISMAIEQGGSQDLKLDMNPTGHGRHHKGVTWHEQQHYRVFTASNLTCCTNLENHQAYGMNALNSLNSCIANIYRFSGVVWPPDLGSTKKFGNLVWEPGQLCITLFKTLLEYLPDIIYWWISLGNSAGKLCWTYMLRQSPASFSEVAN